MKIASIVQPISQHLGPDDSLSEVTRGVTCTLDDEVVPLANQATSQNYTHIAVVDDLGNLVGIADLSPYQEGSPQVQHREEALDDALEETFPASDPISPP